MKYAILSTTLDEEYSFYAPLTARMWNEIGYSPWLCLYGTPRDWQAPHLKLIVDEVTKVGAVYYLGNVTGCSKALAIKLSRWYCAGLFKDDDYLLTSDVDLWPLSFAWYNSQDPEKRFHLFNADIHGGAMHSTCHIGARAERWRQLMKIAKNDEPAKLIEKSVAESFSKHDSSWIGRRSDEQFMKVRVLDYGAYPADFQFIDRGSPPTGRVDRESWPEKVESGGNIDAHLLRPGTDPRIWRMVKGLIPAHLSAWTEKYRDEYLAVKK